MGKDASELKGKGILFIENYYSKIRLGTFLEFGKCIDSKGRSVSSCLIEVKNNEIVNVPVENTKFDDTGNCPQCGSSAYEFYEIGYYCVYGCGYKEWRFLKRPTKKDSYNYITNLVAYNNI